MRLFLPSVILEKSGVSDRIDMGMSRGSVGGFPEVRVVTRSIGGMGEVEVFRLIERFVDG